MPARLFRVEEVTTPGVLPAGRYFATRHGRVIAEVVLEEPTRPSEAIVKILRRPAA